MKIEKIYVKDLGPVGDAISPIDLKDMWGKKIYSSVLFSGPNGCGKTILLDSIAFLWEALAQWLSYRTLVPEDNNIKQRFTQWGGVALLIAGVPDFVTETKKKRNVASKDLDEKVFLFWGDEKWIEDIRKENKDVRYWFGEVKLDNNKWRTYGLPMDVGDISPEFKHAVGEEIDDDYKIFFNNWESAYKKLVLSGNDTGTPNMIYLDSEERKWVKPGKNIGKLVPDDLTKGWLFRYTATEDWKDQLENTLVNLKITSSEKEFNEVIRILNTFFSDKGIVTKYRTGDRNRLRIQLKNGSEKFHYFDELSAGERQVLIVLFNVIRWMRPGGIVMIDEPNLFLHPSLVTRLLSTLEGIVERRNGQLIVTSHNKDVWNRYENLGKRISLGEPL